MKKIYIFIILLLISNYSLFAFGKKGIKSEQYEKITISLPSINKDNGIKWLCFPLESDSNSVKDLLEPLLFDAYYDAPLKEIKYIPPGGYFPQEINFIIDCWSNIKHKIYPTQGYKIKMKADEPFYLELKGKLPNPKTEIKLFPRTQNWIGYFVKNSAYPKEAFSDIFPHIQYIITQHWSWHKFALPFDVSNILDRYTLNFGDMVIVGVDSLITFHWNTNTKEKRKIKAETENFHASQKMNYLPFYVKLDDNIKYDEKSEIAIFADDVCMGSSKIIDNIISVPLYPYKNNIAKEELKIFLHREKGDTLLSFMLFDPFGRKVKSLSIGKGRYYFAILNKELKDTSSKNTEIEIEYYDKKIMFKITLPKKDKIDFFILDRNGNIINTLFENITSAGEFKIYWDKTDKNKKSLPDGIYFYKLKMQNSIKKGTIFLMNN